jgi:glutathione S-transferase
MSGLDDEVKKVRARTRAAMDEQSAQGSTREGVLEAGVRAALDYALTDLDRDLTQLERLLGEKIDAGSFLMGAQALTLALQGVNFNDVASKYAPLLREYMAKARQRHPGDDDAGRLRGTI